MLKGNSIFVDGGTELFRTNGTTTLGFNSYLVQIDMSKSWDAATNFSETVIGRFGNSSTGQNPPSVVRGGLYRGPANSTNLFTFGGSTFLANTSFPGWESPTPDHYSLWSYDTSLQTWGHYDLTAASPRRPNRGAMAEAATNGLAFWLNGEIDRGSSDVTYSISQYVGGMIVLNLNDQSAQNVSTADLGLPRLAGGLVFIDQIGQDGALIAFGGMYSAENGTNTFTNGLLLDFSTVALCDSFLSDNVTWFNQTTSGPVPPPRMGFCTLPSLRSAPDNSSYNLYMHGGIDPIKNILYDDVWVLSLPSFTWAQVYNGSQGRYGHSCHNAGNRQMISIGGSLDASMYEVETTAILPNLSALTCDPNPGGVNLFDMSEGGWSSVFDAHAPTYQVPQAIVDAIGGTPDGGATVTTPAGGFAATELAAMFSPQPTSTSTSSTSSGAIAGGVVGGVAGIAIVAGAAWTLLLRRRRRTRAQAAANEQQEMAVESERKELPAGYEDGMGAPTELSGECTREEMPADLERLEKDRKLESPTTAELPA
ncbi:hypothetical protein K490DRAFT_44039 [Saccharata proteae CBS 121410]|uniref:Cell wall anchored protein n=1 Tax=Saccharata proteae CBS 121410 TaxID=1314787 RepID=A0A9P4HR74_9PEZI|nr:hypothetical protein K490DRAFT_44039 [Saccharata proteae CBS 121410]